jgi:uncharacterized protein YndB with AHSA1/START domain
MIDVHEQVNAVRREVGDRVLEAGEARCVILRREYRAAIDDVWDACTDPARIARWFLPISGDLELGGRYQFEGNAGGTITTCERPSKVAATWEFREAVSWVELRLTAEADERTVFELEHIALVDEHWDQYGPGAVGIGWDLGLLGLSLYLESDSAPPHEEMEAWTASDEGCEFATLSGQAWGEAAIAGGEDPEAARKAAENTIGFYTVPAQPA